MKQFKATSWEPKEEGMFDFHNGGKDKEFDDALARINNVYDDIFKDNS